MEPRILDQIRIYRNSIPTGDHEMIQAKLHGLFHGVLCHKYPRNKGEGIILRFILTTGINIGFLNAKWIAGAISMLLWCVRSVMISEYRKNQEENIFDLSKTNVTSVYSILDNLRGIIAEVVAHQSIMPNSFWEKQTLFIKDQFINLKDLRGLAKGISMDLEKIFKKIYPWSTMEEIDACKIRDKPGTTADHYAWFTEIENQKRIRQFSSPYLVISQDQMDNIWCLKKYVEEYEVSLLVLIHLTSGLPARSTEYSKFLLTNTTTDVRSLYWENGHFTIHQKYSKTDRFTVCRRLAGAVTQHLMRYLLILRPFIFKLGRENGRDFRSNWLFSHHGELNTAKFRRKFRSLSLKHMKKNITYQLYRHIAVGMGRRYIPDVEIPINRALQFMQAGHGEETARRNYCVTSNQVNYSSPETVKFYVEYSKLWNEMIYPGGEEVESMATEDDDDDLMFTEGSDEDSDSSDEESVDALVSISDIPDEAASDALECFISDQQMQPHEVYTGDTAVVPGVNVAINQRMRDLGLQCKFNMDEIYPKVIREMDTIGIFPTSSGKTNFFVLCASMEEKITIVVFPLKALLMDMKQRFESLGVLFTVWEKNVDSNCKKLVFVSAENASSEDFIHFIYRLQATIGRIMYDEAHLFITTREFRHVMILGALVRVIPVPQVFLSATIPPSMVKEIMKNFAVSRVSVVRYIQPRLNLEYRFVKDQRPKVRLHAEVESFIRNCNHADRMIIFFYSKATCDQVAREFIRHGTKYHGDMANEEQVESFNAWKVGTKRVMLCTSGLGAGINYPSVRKVIHYGFAHSLVDWVQETGRGGREGEHCLCVTIFHPSELGQQRAVEMQRLYRSGDCRRRVLNRGINDVETLSCASTHGVPCDVCHSMSVSTTQSLQVIDAPFYTEKLFPEDVGAESSFSLDQSSERCIRVRNKYHTDLTRLYDLLKRPRFCTTCLLDKRKMMHPRESCPFWRNRCFQCGSDRHVRRDCPENRDVRHICRFCLIPIHLHNSYVHNSCASGGKDIIPAFAIAYSIKRPEEFRRCYGFDSEKERISSWLVRESHGLTNACRVFLDYPKV